MADLPMKWLNFAYLGTITHQSFCISNNYSRIMMLSDSKILCQKKKILNQASKKYTVNRNSPKRDCYNNSTIQVRKGLSSDDTSLCKCAGYMISLSTLFSQIQFLLLYSPCTVFFTCFILLLLSLSHFSSLVF